MAKTVVGAIHELPPTRKLNEFHNIAGPAKDKEYFGVGEKDRF